MSKKLRRNKLPICIAKKCTCSALVEQPLMQYIVPVIIIVGTNKIITIKILVVYRVYFF